MATKAPADADKFVWDALTIVKPKPTPKPQALSDADREDVRVFVERWRAVESLLQGDRNGSIMLGGPGSGNKGHAGRPGQVGGSASEGDSAGPDSGGSRATTTTADTVTYQQNPTPDAFIEARNRSTRMGFLSPLTPDDLKDQKLYLSTDGTVGGAMTKDGDMGNLFNNGGPPGAAREVLLQMLADGGKTADAFDGYLPHLYAQFGLKETGRMVFNPDYAPKGWNYEKHDHPDVVFLARTGEAGTPDDIRARLKDDSQWIDPREPGDKYYDDYDLAKRDATRAYTTKHGGTKALGAVRENPRLRVGRQTRRDDSGGSPRTGRAINLYRDKLARHLGGAGSGNFGHVGRPGEVGGSGGGGTDTGARPRSSRTAREAGLPLVGAAPTKQTSTEAMRAEPPPKNLAEAETRIRGEANEHGVFIGPDGAVMRFGNDAKKFVKLYHEVEGDVPLKDGVFTHNHPSGHGLSGGDGEVAALQNLREIRAVTMQGTHSIRRTGKTWPPQFDIQVRKVEDQIKDDFTRRIRQKQMTIAQAEERHHVELYQRLQKKVGGFVYTFTAQP